MKKKKKKKTKKDFQNNREIQYLTSITFPSQINNKLLAFLTAEYRLFAVMVFLRTA
jgi:hypothetical protein